MPKPPKTPPHSDLSGVHQDERCNVEAATDADQDNSDLARAKKQSIGRPEHRGAGKGRDDRTG